MGTTDWKWKVAQKAEIKWWQSYLKGKDIQSYLAWKKQYWQDLYSQVIPSINPMAISNVLDVGCGPAGIFMIFPKNVQVLALDPLLNSYEKNLTHFNPQWYKNVRFVSKPFEQFNTEEKFDLVFCMNVINHVQQIELCYDLLVRSMKDNGTLVVTIDAHNFQFFKYLFRILPGDILHPHQYDLEEYKNHLTSRGLTIISEKKLKSEFFFDHWMLIAKKS